MMEAARDKGSQDMTCPTCNARQVWSDECRRCKTDLSLLCQIWQTAEAERRQCLRELAAGQPHRALRHAHCYAAYVGRAQASRLVRVCSLLCGNWPDTLRG